jgi:MarR-like DNA-binding transcriptional regulator SgrR of sgrS sRNA
MYRRRTVIAGILAGILVVVGGSMALTMNKEKKDRTLRIAFPAQVSVHKYEPTAIHFAHEYLLLENLYSPLVEADPKGGGLLPGIADTFKWNGDELVLTIRKGLKTKGGNQITGKDVVFSLKRLLVLSGNTHGNFKELVCPEAKLKSVEQECAGIELRGEAVVLRAGKRKSFLLPMLSTLDFAIIPQAAVDPKTLAIADFSETSGPYYVAKDSETGDIELKLNSQHYHAADDIADRVVLVPVERKSFNAALKAYEEGRADHVMSYSGSRPEDMIALSKDRSDTDLHMTMKIQNVILVFTDKGRRELSPEYRRYIGSQTKVAFEKIYAETPGYEKSNEFFPALGDGGLSRERQAEVKKIFLSESVNEQTPFRLGFLKSGGLDPWGNPVREALPQADIYFETQIPAFADYKNLNGEPHAFICTIDSGFSEDISLISYAMNAGVFGFSPKKRVEWLSHYMELPDKAQRMDALRQLHFDSIAQAALVPLVVSPYVALVRKPWKMNLSELYANNPLWLIKHQ